MSADPGEHGKGPRQYAWSDCFRTDHGNCDPRRRSGRSAQGSHLEQEGGRRRDLLNSDAPGHEDLSFKVGRRVVTNSTFRSEDYQEPTLNQVFGEAIFKIIDRLKQSP
ncbi:hypothetical protein [Amycolatopsis sp. La24]|uniref:hypothetical protein n=1 Tax=Amycolatopsis sp. La24 TaxID=3028304 RepID=UPI0023AFEFEE|nr:hypothetical protein [Amycolatopsis sp. La24]